VTRSSFLSADGKRLIDNFPCAVSPERALSHPLLTAPIGPSLLRLAGPTTGLMVVQIFVAIADTYFIGRLGTDALAGVALVFPFTTLMLNIAAGGMGGGVAAAMARALGAGRLDDARALVLHTLVLGVAFALIFTALAWTVGPALYELSGGSGVALQRALTFSRIWFGGAVAVWISFFFSALLRGGGDAVTPGRYGLLLSVVYVPLSGALALGFGDWAGLGVAGPAIASAIVNSAAVLLLARALWRGRLGFIPRLAGVRLQGRLFGEILRVGAISSITTLTGSLAAMLVTSLVGRFGVAALAGYSIGVRMEFMLGPLAFGIGSGLTTLVGVAAGAEAWPRAVRVAWTGALIAFACIGALGWTVVLVPETWSRVFTSEPQVIAASVSFITHVAPFYCLLGLGLTLNFASQGAGRMTAPVVASFARMLTATLGGWFAVEKLGLGLGGVFTAIAAGMAVYGCLIAGALLIVPWGPKRRAFRARLGFPFQERSRSGVKGSA
jgi:putative MATE family efflux protein